jgi:Tol biopolymer transport system component
MRWFSLALAALVLTGIASHAEDAPTGKIVYPRKEGNHYTLHVMTGDGTGDRALTSEAGADCAFPAWSPDGKRITYTSMTTGNGEQFKVCVINADGTERLTVNTPSPRSGLSSWSPDGKLIAFASGDQRPNVYVSEPNGNGLKQLNPEGSGGFGTFWMPDGKKVGYTRFEGNAEPSGKIVLVAPDGTGEENLTQEPAFAIAGANALSPDGKRLAYIVMNPQGMKVGLRVWDMVAKSENFIMDLDTDQSSQIASIPLAAWAPDSKSLLLSIKTEKGYGLFKVSDDGKTRTRLTPEGVDCLSGSWTTK